MNKLIDLAGLVLICIVVLLIIWNGINGRGYKISYKIHPINTTLGIIDRIVGLIVVFVCFFFVVSLKSNGFTDSDTRQIVLLAATAFIGSVAYGVWIRKK